MPPPRIITTSSSSTNIAKGPRSQQQQEEFDALWKDALALYHGEDDIERDEDKAFQIFYSLAQKGHEPSMLELGCMYFMGSGVEKSFKQAKFWWKKLSSDPEALYGLGLIYHMGREEENLAPEPKRALKAWKKAAHGNNFNAVACLEKYYPNWNPGNRTPNSFYDSDSSDSSPRQSSKKRTLSNHSKTHFFTGDGTNGDASPLTPLSPVKHNAALSPAAAGSSTLARRRSSLVHELGKRAAVQKAKYSGKSSLTTHSSGNSHLTAPHSPTSKALIKESSETVNDLAKSLNYMKSQMYDVQATVNVMNSSMIKDTAALQESVVALQTEVKELGSKVESCSLPCTPRDSPVSSSRTSSTSESQKMQELNDRVHSLERKMKSTLVNQEHMMKMLQQITGMLKMGKAEPEVLPALIPPKKGRLSR